MEFFERKLPTTIELWEKQQQEIKKGFTAAETLIEIWKLGYQACQEDMTIGEDKSSK